MTAWYVRHQAKFDIFWPVWAITFTAWDWYKVVQHGGKWTWGVAIFQTVVSFALILVVRSTRRLRALSRRIEEEHRFWHTIAVGYEVDHEPWACPDDQPCHVHEEER